MPYKVKHKKTEFAKDSKRLIRIYEVLDNEAFMTYNAQFNELDKKSQKEIAKKVMKEEYPYGI